MRLVRRGFRYSTGLFALALALTLAIPALAQESLDHGKSPAQMFASDCAVCHKSPQGLAKSGGLLGLDSFLREHYTASRESAAKLSAYLRAAEGPPAAPAKRTRREGDSTSSDRPKGTAKKPADAKPADAKAEGSKPADAKPAESKPGETKPSDSKPAEAKPSEAKTEAKPESKPAEAKPESAATPDKAN